MLKEGFRPAERESRREGVSVAVGGGARGRNVSWRAGKEVWVSPLAFLCERGHAPAARLARHGERPRVRGALEGVLLIAFATHSSRVGRVERAADVPDSGAARRQALSPLRREPSCVRSRIEQLPARTAQTAAPIRCRVSVGRRSVFSRARGGGGWTSRARRPEAQARAKRSRRDLSLSRPLSKQGRLVEHQLAVSFDQPGASAGRRQGLEARRVDVSQPKPPSSYGRGHVTLPLATARKRLLDPRQRTSTRGRCLLKVTEAGGRSSPEADQVGSASGARRVQDGQCAWSSRWRN